MYGIRVLAQVLVEVVENQRIVTNPVCNSGDFRLLFGDFVDALQLLEKGRSCLHIDGRRQHRYNDGFRMLDKIRQLGTM